MENNIECNANSTNEDIAKAFNSLSVIRNELNNIRKDIRRLKICHHKEIESINNMLKLWKCESCGTSIEEKNSELVKNTTTNVATVSESSVPLLPIGVISTSFPEKRGTPRQTGICQNSQGSITLLNTVFNNPEHALEGLNEYSHMWIIFHFHKNESTHVRAKVSPPRLNGLKTGVFSTRSPHRPSPIGLSLVHIDYIDENTIYFSGVDMVDGTPVLDIKPFIPQYDNPLLITNQWNNRAMKLTKKDSSSSVVTSIDRSTIPREAPDGEEDAETENEIKILNTNEQVQVRVPRWVTDSTVGNLKVTFKNRARSDLDAIKQETKMEDGRDDSDEKEDIEICIVKILQEDPRSVYVRGRHSNQFFTFLIGKYHVTCKFDDDNRSVQVYKIITADS